MKKTLKQRIEHLNKLGYGVTLKHYRVSRPTNDPEGAIALSPRGGKTVAFIYPLGNEEKVLVAGVANCSDQDNYNKRIGGNIALGRAEKKLSSF